MIEILIGIASGIVSGTGMGGGTILIFLLTFLCGIDQHVAQAANLIFFIPTSIVATIVNLKNKNIDLKLAIIIYIWNIRSNYWSKLISSYRSGKIKKNIWNFFSNNCYT